MLGEPGSREIEVVGIETPRDLMIARKPLVEKAELLLNSAAGAPGET